MPASIITDMNMPPSANQEEARALQLAFEQLSIFGLNQDMHDETYNVNDDNALNNNIDMDQTGMPTIEQMQERIKGDKKSANMTECVPVPSSEHVAEIVGRQGCKIKALRAKTNTYIKTPVRGEEPVFVVTGRKEDVCSAKREILSAAEHFSQIRASRRAQPGQVGLPPGPPSPGAPGQLTIQVRVPYRVVGLVVGPKGATIKRIQQQTHTYIVTPSRDKEPVFEVTGGEENVEKARIEIEAHIAMRTGGLLAGEGGDSASPPLSGCTEQQLNQLNDFHSNGIDSAFQDLQLDLLGSLYKPPSTNSAFSSYRQGAGGDGDCVFTFPGQNGAGQGGGINSFMYEDDNSPNFTDPNSVSAGQVWADLSAGRPADVTSSAFTPIAGLFGLSSASGGPVVQRSTSLNMSPTPTDSSSNHSLGSGGSPPGYDHHQSHGARIRRMHSEPLGGALQGLLSTAVGGAGSPEHVLGANHGSTSPSSLSASPTDTQNGGRPRHCLVCMESEVVAALVPCGHNLFCMECASLIVEKPEMDRRCPVCTHLVSQAIRIFS